MYVTGIVDEAATSIAGQAEAAARLGWHCVELRGIGGKNITDVDDAEFDIVCETLDATKLKCNCFASAVGSWAKNISDSPESSYAELRRAIPRMQRLGTKMIRMMSFYVPVEHSRDAAIATEVFRRVNEMAKMAEDGGVLLVHENCNNWGGRSYEHTLRLLDAVKSPAFRLLFDTGNPVFSLDVRGNEPYKYQSSIEFFRQVREHVEYVHIKDGRMSESGMVFTWPGEGDGNVREVLSELLDSGYDGGFSMEPHIEVIYHEKDSAGIHEERKIATFVEYGQRFRKLLNECCCSINKQN